MLFRSVGSHAKNQPLLGKNEKRPKMSVRTFLPGALQLQYIFEYSSKKVISSVIVEHIFVVVIGLLALVANVPLLLLKENE